MRSQQSHSRNNEQKQNASPRELIISESDKIARAQILSLLENTGSLATLLEDPTPKYDRLADVLGLRIIEKRNLYEDDTNLYFCDKHAFTSLGYDVPWEMIGGDTMALLRNAGFSLSNTPVEPGGIVYGNYRGEVFSGVHVGIVRGDKIESKFSYGHIIEHDTNLIFPRWGTHLIYFHK